MSGFWASAGIKEFKLLVGLLQHPLNLQQTFTDLLISAAACTLIGPDYLCEHPRCMSPYNAPIMPIASSPTHVCLILRSIRAGICCFLRTLWQGFAKVMTFRAVLQLQVVDCPLQFLPMHLGLYSVLSAVRLLEMQKPVVQPGSCSPEDLALQWAPVKGEQQQGT